MLGLLMADVRLDAPRLAAFSAFDVFQFFGVDQSVEEEVRPGITMTKPVRAPRGVWSWTGRASFQGAWQGKRPVFRLNNCLQYT